MNITSDILQHFAEFSPIDSAVYRVRNGVLETLFLSENVPELLGMTREEYLKITSHDAMDLALPQDRSGLMAATLDCISTGKKLDYYYRVYSNKKGFDWVHVDAHVCGTMDGDAVIIARFANISKEGGIFETILDNSDRITVVIDRHSHEVLYANEKIKQNEYFDGTSLLDKMCYQLLYGRDEPCENCFNTSDDSDEEIHERYDYNEGKETWNLITWRNIKWCMQNAVIIYIKDVTEEQNDKIALDRVSQRYRMAVDDVKQMLWEYDPKHRTVTYRLDNAYTKEMCDKLGMPGVIGNVPDSILGSIDEEFREDFMKMFDLNKLDQEGTSCEYSSTIGGETQWWRVTSRPIYDLDRRLQSVYCSAVNITEEKQAEKNYRNLLTQISGMHDMGISNFRLNLTQNRLISGHSVYPQWDDQLQTLTVNEHFNVVADSIADAQISEQVRSEYNCAQLIDKYKQGIRQLSQDYPVRSQVEPTEGQVRWFHAVNYLIMNPDTGDIEDISSVTEITKQKKNEKILDSMASKGCDYIGIIDVLHETVEIFNGVWKDKLSMDAGSLDYKEALNELIDSYVADEDKNNFDAQTLIKSMTEKLETEEEAFIHYNFVEENKNMLKKQIKCKWLDDEKREILVVQDDITEAYMKEQKRMYELQDALKQAEVASKAKTDFVSRISHDIRTPISAIISMTEFAKEDIDDKEKLLDDISKISSSNKFLLSLINDILDISKIDSGKMELYPERYTFDEFVESISDIFVPLCEQKNIEFKILHNDITESSIIVDKVRFNQIALNLLSNAVKYTPEGGKITFASESEILDDGKIKCAYTISDTGIGMSEDFQKRMFEPFEREDGALCACTGQSGTGLGLSIVKRIVDIMGGSISVKSKLNEGTAITVSIVLPRAAKEQAESSVNKESTEFSSGSLLKNKVLLAEDNEINTEVAVRLLKKLGLEIESVANGKLAVEAFGQSKPGEFLAILMDIQMPVMDGYTATEHIRALDRDDAKTIPIIAMTADAFIESIQRSQDAGMNDHITKPIDVKKLETTLTRYLDKKVQ